MTGRRRSKRQAGSDREDRPEGLYYDWVHAYAVVVQAFRPAWTAVIQVSNYTVTRLRDQARDRILQLLEIDRLAEDARHVELRGVGGHVLAVERGGDDDARVFGQRIRAEFAHDGPAVDE